MPRSRPSRSSAFRPMYSCLPRLARASYLSLVSLGTLFLGCSGDDAPANRPPTIVPLADTQATVERELLLSLRASDPDGDAITFSFKADVSIDDRAEIVDLAPGRARFRWTPAPSDVGLRALDLIATDSRGAASRLTISVDVSSAGSTAPIFRQPLGTGTTLDLTRDTCVSVPILVEDPDTAGIVLSTAEGAPEGSSLTQDTETTGSWSWCPTDAQIASDDRYPVRFLADDGQNPATSKDYLIVLRTVPKSGCPGGTPIVEHTAASSETLLPLEISAHVTDDLGLKYEPLFYYSLSDPGPNPDIAQMTQLTMSLKSGDTLDGTWIAQVPNPVAGQPAGTSQQLYYLIEVQDDDDAQGTCDHLVRSPATASYSMQVTSPGGTGGLGLCEVCSADVQCGGERDHCVSLDGSLVCLVGCTTNTDCPDGSLCSDSALFSIDGASARQCIPATGSCSVQVTCADDPFEENDSLAQALGAAPLPVNDVFDLVSCPSPGGIGDDPDYFLIKLNTPADLLALLQGSDVTDLDIALLDATGDIVAASATLASTEELSIPCLAAGDYVLRVKSYGQARNPYQLGYDLTAATCGPVCDDDPEENDDSAVQARPVDLDAGVYLSDTNAICAGDQDWYGVSMFAGEKLQVRLTFSQATPKEDLDIRLYKDGVDLIGCTEEDPTGCTINGQSGDANEQMIWDVTSTGTYYVVVHGWDGSENLYDICIGLQGQCNP